MAKFTYKAIAPTGDLLEGGLSAETEAMAASELRRRGVLPLQIARAERPKPKFGLTLASGNAKFRPKHLLLFTRELGVLLGAGYPLDRVLERLSAMGDDRPLRTLAGDLLSDVRNGSTLADAMAKHPQIFPAFYVGMVKAGEIGGSLVPVLRRIIDALEKSADLQEKMRSAILYPIMVLGLTVISIVILLVWVIPQFKPMFESSGDKLPLSARMIMSLSDFAIHWGWAVALGLVLVIVLARQVIRRAHHQQRAHGLLLGLPLLGPLMRKGDTARFARTLATLIASGTTLLTAVRIAADSIANRAISAGIRSAVEQIAKGERLAEALRNTGMLPSLALQIIEVGEESGRLQDMLAMTADVYDQEVETEIKRLLAVLVPLITIGLGVVVAGVIGVMLSAILSTYELSF